jgi:hypothetical protein
MKIYNLNRDNVWINKADNGVASFATDGFESGICVSEGIIFKLEDSMFTFRTFRHLGRSLDIGFVAFSKIGAPIILSRKPQGRTATTDIVSTSSLVINDGEVRPVFCVMDIMDDMDVMDGMDTAQPAKSDFLLYQGENGCAVVLSGFKAAHLRHQAKRLQAKIPVVKIREDRCPGADLWAALSFVTLLPGVKELYRPALSPYKQISVEIITNNTQPYQGSRPANLLPVFGMVG